MYKKDDGQSSFTTIKVYYSSDPDMTLTELDFNTQYVVEVKPFREHKGKVEFGNTYPILHAKTTCIGKPSCFFLISWSSNILLVKE